MEVKDISCNDAYANDLTTRYYLKVLEDNDRQIRLW